MSTLVQIKRSTANVAPASLLEGELAYSYLSNTLFIGDTANAAINIGGKYYTTMLDNRNAANGAGTIVIRNANGSSQFSQLDILLLPTANSHVATKEYVDQSVSGNVTLASLNDVDIGAPFSDQNNKILIGNSAGYYVGTNVSGNVSLSNTGVFTIGSSQVTNSMLAGSITNDKLANSSVTVTAGAGLGGGGAVALGSTVTLDVIAGDGISNSNGDTVSVNTTVVRTDRNQTLNGFMSFSNTVTINADLSVTGNINLTGNTTYVNVATLNVSDPLIFIAANNITSDLVDIGIFGTYNDGANVEHTGLVRHASDKIWYLFEHELLDPSNNIVDVANSTYALLRANLEAKSLLVTGSNTAANINTALEVTGNTTLKSNLSVAGNATVTGDLTVSGGDILSSVTANLLNVTSTTINFGGAATDIKIGAPTGNTTINHNLIVAENSEANVFISNRTALAAPSLTGFNGERLRLYDFDQAGHPNYAIGVEPNYIWTGVDDNTAAVGFKWYGNTSLAMQLSGNGVLQVANSINTNAIFATSLTLGTPLGVGSGGTGANSFTANGVFYGGTTTSLSFATGTEGNVLQITSGVPTFGMLDGGSF